MDNSKQINTKTDIYRDTPLRYLGYANEVGEAFRSIIATKWVNLSYGIATLYVLADTTHKSFETFQEHKVNDNYMKKTLHKTSDTLAWQMLASVVFPGFTINRVCAVANFFLKKSKNLPKNNRKWVVTGIGLVTIPFIIKPIDNLVDTILDQSLRKIEP